MSKVKQEHLCRRPRVRDSEAFPDLRTLPAPGTPCVQQTVQVSKTEGILDSSGITPLGAGIRNMKPSSPNVANANGAPGRETTLIKAPSTLAWDPQSRPRAQGDREKPGDTDLLGLREGLESYQSVQKKSHKKRSVTTKTKSSREMKDLECEKQKFS